MKRKALGIAISGFASAALLVVPSLQGTASARPRMHVVHCQPGSTPQNPCRGTNGPDRIFGTPGNDFINGGNGNDLISGDAGDDTINGGNGKDTISGDDGNDSLNGGNGKDDLNGGTGDDVEHGGNGKDQIGCGDGSDAATDDTGDDMSADCEQTIQTFVGTVTAYDGSTITLDVAGTPVTANVTPATELKDGAPTVGDTVKLEAVPNAADNTQLDALEIEIENEAIDDNGVDA